MATKAALSMDDKIAELDRRLACVNADIAGARRRLLPHRLLAGISASEADQRDRLEADLDRMLRRQTSLIETRDTAVRAAMIDAVQPTETPLRPRRVRSWEIQAFGLTARLRIIDARDHAAAS